MTRQITGITKDAYSYLIDVIPRAVKSESIYQIIGTADIELSDAVILKSYDDGIILDLGARTVTLEAGDFREITVR